MTELIIRSAGAHTTVQDLGRFGFQSLGVSPSGAMDRDALETANLLVGNPRGEACLECVLAGAEFECSGEVAFAVCGAPMGFRLNGTPAPAYETLVAAAGDVVSLGAAERGLCAYVAFAGGFAITPVLGSLSTYARAGFGGWHGRPLRAGDRIPLRGRARVADDSDSRGADRHDVSTSSSRLYVPEAARPRYNGEITLRAIASHESGRFEPESLRAFFSESFSVGSKSDRMGCRLEGPRLKHLRGADILSSGVQTGTVQVPGDGAPIILRAERQTTGGYARIAHVIQADLPALGQLRPGDRVNFREVSVASARREWLAREARVVGAVRRARRFAVTVDGVSYDVELRDVAE